MKPRTTKTTSTTTRRVATGASILGLALAMSPALMSVPAQANGSAKGCEKKFDATLAQHLGAIDNRDLAALDPTVDESMTLIFPSGSIRDGKAAFMAFHEGWFADPNWRQPATVIRKNVQGCATAWVLVDYRYEALNPDGTVASSSHNMFALTWTFKHGRWVAIADQNTKLPS